MVKTIFFQDVPAVGVLDWSSCPSQDEDLNSAAAVIPVPLLVVVVVVGCWTAVYLTDLMLKVRSET